MWRQGVLPYPDRRLWPKGYSTQSRAWPSSATAEWRQAAATGCLPEDAGLSSWRWTRSPRFTLNMSRDRNQLLCAKKRYTCTRQIKHELKFSSYPTSGCQKTRWSGTGRTCSGSAGGRSSTVARSDRAGGQVGVGRSGEWVLQCYDRGGGGRGDDAARACLGLLPARPKGRTAAPRAHLSRMHAPFATVHLQLLKGTVGISISAKICRSKIYALRPNLMLASFLTWIINVASFKMQTATFTTLHSREHSATCTDCVQCTRIQHWQRTNRAVGN